MTISTFHTFDDIGNELDTCTLQAHAVAVDQTFVDAVRDLAYAEGRILERDGLLVATLGTAARLRLDTGLDEHIKAVGQLLSFIAHRSGDLPVSPLALAALPYDLENRCEFVIPQISVINIADQPAYVIYVGSQDDLPLLAARDLVTESAQRMSGPQPEPPDRFVLDTRIHHEQFKAKVSEAIEAITAGTMSKVVLAREVAISANRPFYQADFMRRLRALHPSCLAFAIDGFVGATPELLLQKVGASVTSVPLAGTIARSGDPDEDARQANALLHSSKDRDEHQFVVDAITQQLREHALYLQVPKEPHILELRNVVHLATTITATLHDTVSSALELAAELHPTPAVCGTPRETAHAYIAAHEQLSRDRYAGLVGYVNAAGDGEWWIGIRSAIIDGNAARLFAGVGIIKHSDPTQELAETQLKLQALLAVLVRP